MWKYFTYIDPHFAKCDICKIKISHKTTMSNLKKDIERKHPLINLNVELEYNAINVNQPSKSNVSQQVIYKLT